MITKLFISTLLLTLAFSSEAKVMKYKKIQEMAVDVLKENTFSLLTDSMEDVGQFCPNYNNFDLEDKMNFFGHLVAQMAIYESDNDPSTTFLESNGNISAGLLGISYGSIGSVYKSLGCDFLNAEDLKDPYKNLKCGFAIISRWTNQHGYLAFDDITGASVYWSTLREPYYTEIVLSNGNRKQVKVGKKFLIIDGLKNKFPACFKK